MATTALRAAMVLSRGAATISGTVSDRGSSRREKAPGQRTRGQVEVDSAIAFCRSATLAKRRGLREALAVCLATGFSGGPMKGPIRKTATVITALRGARSAKRETTTCQEVRGGH